MNNFKLLATAPMGIEAIVANEVRNLGYECKVDNGKILYTGDAMTIARSNLWLRTADRIKIIVGEFKATTFDQLFEGTKALPWEQFLNADSEFPVSGKSVKSKLYSVPDCQGIVKKAIVERLKSKYKQVSWFEEKGPKVPIEVSILKDKVTLTIDTSGTGLHRRGYRVGQGEAPLKETLAAALILLTNWTYDRPFVDPFCGSGTLPIEAALIGQNIAPGFNREFISEGWHWMPKSVWDDARMETEDLAQYDRNLQIFGSDIDHKMVDIAKNNALEAGLGDLIQFKQMQATDFHSDLKYGVVVANPPYGERLGDKEKVEQLYRDLGKTFQALDTWSIYVITSNEQFEELYGKQATKKRKLFNGFIKTDYYQYWGPRVPKG
ncbi:class I SAM-dependent RNA methyltransferase [Caldibacillus lycopersici]|uniref:Class I SAM-dependent RNA methyltransferase n=1 Tax=Perspicuibacillus lycopersici TaxID=1325689 RepID=A0AAE3ISH6_9BACI|nr:class I SAM-dependent RNA methyltransferase [Perspicuibacillus lycopersici]MCU9613666.1 class I SAM-dependent RNA methyltransferase [Perspicuibacillus lycopersici]